MNVIPLKLPNIYPNLNDQQQFRLNKISKVRDYFIAEIRERKLISKNISKYIDSLDYCDNSLIDLSATSGSIFITLFATVIRAPLGIASASLRLAWSLSTDIVKKIVKNNTK